ncbi:MAG: MFS transporter [Cytophagaceae bacterium]|nr:MAG: MFS transporter [Cytophagaceae bacterium]
MMNSLEPTDRRRWAALGALCTSLVVVTIDNTILNTAIPTLARELRATTVDLQWITNAYTLAFAALLITAGGLGARFGHRRILLTGLTLFALGSAFAALSHTSLQLIGWRTVMIHGIMYLWNLGVNIYIVLYFANRNAKRIDLSKGASFNWEGVGATQLLLSFPLMLAPYLIYTPFALLHLQNAGLAAMAIMGVAGIVSRNFWIDKLVQDFNRRKYTITEGFRNQ